MSNGFAALGSDRRTRCRLWTNSDQPDFIRAPLGCLEEFRLIGTCLKYMSERWLSPRELRERAGLTQKEVAVAIGRRKQTISDWERGASRPSLTFAETLTLMRLYQASLDELVRAFDRVDPDEI